jgi:hypothetical protein
MVRLQLQAIPRTQIVTQQHISFGIIRKFPLCQRAANRDGSRSAATSFQPLWTCRATPNKLIPLFRIMKLNAAKNYLVGDAGTVWLHGEPPPALQVVEKLSSLSSVTIG